MGQYICAPYLFSKNGAMLLQGRGTEGGGQETGRKGGRGDGRWEKRGGSGIPKVAGSGRKRRQLCNIAQYFAIKNKDRVEARIKEYGSPLSSTFYKTRSSTKRSPRYISFNNIIVFLCLFVMRVIQ